MRKFEDIKKKKNFRRFDVRNLNRTEIPSRQGRPPSVNPRMRGDDIEKIGPSADMGAISSAKKCGTIRFAIRSEMAENERESLDLLGYVDLNFRCDRSHPLIVREARLNRGFIKLI